MGKVTALQCLLCELGRSLMLSLSSPLLDVSAALLHVILLNNCHLHDVNADLSLVLDCLLLPGNANLVKIFNYKSISEITAGYTTGRQILTDLRI